MVEYYTITELTTCINLVHCHQDSNYLGGEVTKKNKMNRMKRNENDSSNYPIEADVLYSGGSVNQKRTKV